MFSRRLLSNSRPLSRHRPQVDFLETPNDFLLEALERPAIFEPYVDHALIEALEFLPRWLNARPPDPDYDAALGPIHDVLLPPQGPKL